MNATEADVLDSRSRGARIDALRGFAVLGIFVANIQSFSLYFLLPEARRATLPLAAFDSWTEFMLGWLVEGKFYALFSLLFGFGLAMMMASAERRGADIGPLYRRRLAVLLGIGLLHTLVWFGDILLLYALLGFLLLPLRHQPTARLLLWAGVLMALPLLQYLLMWLLIGPQPAPDEQSVQQWASFVDTVLVEMSQGSPAQLFINNLGASIMGRWPDLLFTGRPFRVLGLFVLGFAIGRSGWLAQAGNQGALLRRVLWIGLFIGLPLAALRAGFADAGAYQRLEASGLGYTLLVSLSVPAMALAYAAGVLLLLRRLPALCWLLAPVGRMALSNYLLQTLIGTLLFTTLGLGWAGQLSLSGGVVLAVAVLPVLLLASHLWLRRHRQGPVERLWRRLAERNNNGYNRPSLPPEPRP